MITSLWSLVAQTEQRVEGVSEWSPASKGHLPSKHDQTLQCVTLDMPFYFMGKKVRRGFDPRPCKCKQFSVCFFPF